MNDKHVLSENDIKIPSELGVAKALSVNPDDIEKRKVESIGICYRCKKPIKDWGEGGIHNFSMRIDSYTYPYCTTVLLCSECGWHIQKSIMNFLYE